MKADRKKWKKILVICTGYAAGLLGIGGTAAYLTYSDNTENVIAIGQNTTQIKEDFPEPTPVPLEENPEYTKKVFVANTSAEARGSQVDCYVRMSVGYSHSDIAKGIILQNLDTKNWIYGEDGYYYYIKPLAEGEVTTPLFTGFIIDSEKVEQDYLALIPEFEIQIYEESVQAEGFADYEQAWSSYQSVSEGR